MLTRPVFFLLGMSLACLHMAISAQNPAMETLGLGQALSQNDLDPLTFAQWVEGAERPFEEKLTPQQVIWTRQSNPGSGQPRWNGVTFGEGKEPGPRHMRIGLRSPIAVGTVLMASNSRVSVLKPGAKYPGDLADENQWLAGERFADGKVTRAEVKAKGGIGVWVFPPGTKTLALRISHEAEVTEHSYAVQVGGIAVLAGRLENIGPQATASASANESKAHLLNNESVDGLWGAWDNWDEQNPPPPVVQAPPSVMLNWRQPVALRGLATLWSGFGAVEVQAYVGPAERHPRQGPATDWQTVHSSDNVKSLYPYAFGPQWLDFGKTVTTRAVRLRLLKVTNEGHPHLKGRTQDGRRVWLGDVLAFQPLGDAPLTSALLDEKAELRPPIAIPFTLKEAGYVTLVIDDLAGKRVRNLVSETWFPSGPNVAWWDGQDDLRRDPEAARHGVYHIPCQLVQPGKYRVHGLWGPKIDLRYEFPVYTEGKPAWQTADHTGGWLANHSPPSTPSLCRASKPRVAGPWSFLAVSFPRGRMAWRGSILMAR